MIASGVHDVGADVRRGVFRRAGHYRVKQASATNNNRGNNSRSAWDHGNEEAAIVLTAVWMMCLPALRVTG